MEKLTTENHPYLATVSGHFVIEDLGSGMEFEGPSFAVTVTDNCCEGHAEGAAWMMVNGYLKWHNEVSIEKEHTRYSVVYDGEGDE